MPRLPLHPSKVLEAWRDVASQAEHPVSLVLTGDPLLASHAAERLATGGTVPAIWTKEATTLLRERQDPREIVVLFIPASEERSLLEALQGSTYAPGGGGLVVAVDEAESATGRVSFPVPGCARLSFADTPAGWRRLFGVCLEQAGEGLIALGRRYPVLRRMAARRVILRAARDNGLVGLAFFVPGSDWPVMTLNQLRMVLQLAGLYGRPTDSERVIEAAALVVVGLGFRRLARQLVKPRRSMNWAVKASVGYVGTLALGFAAVEYFERGASASTSRVLAVVSSLKR